MSGVTPLCKSGDSDNTIWMYIEQYRHSLLYISNHIQEWSQAQQSYVLSQYIFKTEWYV